MPEDVTTLPAVEEAAGGNSVDTLGAVADTLSQRHFVRHAVERPNDSIPCLGAGSPVHFEDAQLPQYYKESFFNGSPFYNTEVPPVYHGMAGDPVPYTIASDDILTTALLFCFVLLITAFTTSRAFMLRHIHDIFYVRKGDDDNMGETSGELRLQLFLVLHTILLLAIIYFLFSREHIATTYILPTEYHTIGIYFGAIFAYIILLIIVSSWVNITFFGTKANILWIRNKAFLIGWEGMLLFPLVVVQAFLNLPFSEMAIFYAIIVIFVKILTIYKCFSIFFRRIGYILHIFLYFCTLELIPLALTLGALVYLSNLLKIQY